MVLENRDIDYSIVICTYNPDERLLQRCLRAVAQLNRHNISTEVLLVDNNSTVPVASLPFVQAHLRQIPGMRLLHAPEQGLKYARIAGIEAAAGRHIVFFDDDNEPDSDYLQGLQQLHTLYPNVGAWGPGHVWVEFIDGIAADIERYARVAFQERHEGETAYARLPGWQPCYPFGTGLCIHTLLLKAYVAGIREGQLTLPGRKGRLLSSGDDTQMVLLCISKGYAAGIAPLLKIKHMIPGKRCSYQYLHRLAYGTGVCYDTCLLQVFPEHRQQLEQRLLPAAKFSRQALKQFLRSRWRASFFKTAALINYISVHAGVYMALDKPLPEPVNKILKYLKVT
ncbi:MAG TPA: glycosyltransferase [Chitinophaga sp.]|uniref:glycosyltransferase n=1 Tax=Chitinophaga sp. TaxID=1869181 RepID=UPI002DB56C4B|nr:glycosyltransferase [Chitinophaga sp.]HEU4553857.1 glycosyltransferase [Chitinophaga sp.]